MAFATILGSIALLAGAATLCEAPLAIGCSEEASDSSGLPVPDTTAARHHAQPHWPPPLPLCRLAAAVPPCAQEATASSRGIGAEARLLQRGQGAPTAAARKRPCPLVPYTAPAAPFSNLLQKAGEAYAGGEAAGDRGSQGSSQECTTWEVLPALSPRGRANCCPETSRPTACALSACPHRLQAHHRMGHPLGGSGGGSQPALSPGDRGLRWRR